MLSTLPWNLAYCSTHMFDPGFGWYALACILTAGIVGKAGTDGFQPQNMQKPVGSSALHTNLLSWCRPNMRVLRYWHCMLMSFTICSCCHTWLCYVMLCVPAGRHRSSAASGTMIVKCMVYTPACIASSVSSSRHCWWAAAAAVGLFPLCRHKMCRQAQLECSSWHRDTSSNHALLAVSAAASCVAPRRRMCDGCCRCATPIASSQIAWI